MNRDIRAAGLNKSAFGKNQRFPQFANGGGGDEVSGRERTPWPCRHMPGVRGPTVWAAEHGVSHIAGYETAERIFDQLPVLQAAHHFVEGAREKASSSLRSTGAR